jgi:hypothetical protein
MISPKEAAELTAANYHKKLEREHEYAECMRRNYQFQLEMALKEYRISIAQDIELSAKDGCNNVGRHFTCGNTANNEALLKVAKEFEDQGYKVECCENELWGKRVIISW